MKIDKKKVLEWGQLFFMFLFIMYLGAVLVQKFSPHTDTEFLNEKYSYKCYLPIYFHAGFGKEKESYGSFLCGNKMGGISTVRMFKSTPITISINSIPDIIWCVSVLILGVISWGIYLKRYIVDFLVIWFITWRSS
jgi:hypothetical protein